MTKNRKTAARFHDETAPQKREEPARVCRCQLAERSALGLGAIEELFLDLTRLHCTGIAAGEPGAHMAARELAVSRLGVCNGTTYLARVTTLMDTVRRDRPGPYVFLPACCAVVCPDEMDLIALLRACRFPNDAIVAARADRLMQGMDASAVIDAARAVVGAGQVGASALQMTKISLSQRPAGQALSRTLH